MNILVVDDSSEIRLIIKHYLLKFKHTVDLAVDGDDAWEKINKDEYQVIICDWKMPKLNGLKLCEKIRNHHFDRYLYFILLTGMSGKHNILDAIKAGVDDFVSKPIESDELEIRLRSATRVLELESSLERKNKVLKKINDKHEIDLKNATETQLCLLPLFLNNDNIKSAWFYQPAIFVGGDTFNYFSPSPDFLVFFNLDVSGHGISSAMLSMFLQSTLGLKRSLYGGCIDRESAYSLPEVFAKNLNEMLLEISSDHYITMIFGIVDFKQKELHYVQAGHPQPLWYSQEKQELSEININGFPIGLIPSATYETQHINYKPGDKFIIYSDGISETNSALNNKIFDSTVLFDHFNQIKNDPPTQMIETIKDSWLIKENLKNLPDDINFLIFEFQ
jgi:sigma-B regulation protein RsbU (phosphoserine phosphatase)